VRGAGGGGGRSASWLKLGRWRESRLLRGLRDLIEDQSLIAMVVISHSVGNSQANNVKSQCCEEAACQEIQHPCVWDKVNVIEILIGPSRGLYRSPSDCCI